MDSKEKNTQLFLYLVGSFEMSAMMAMGKIKNPVTDKTEKDMNQAQFSIDLLDMIKDKTKGNISDYEAKYLENISGQLKLNYIDEANKDTKKPEDTLKPEAGNNEKPEEKEEEKSEEDGEIE